MSVNDMTVNQAAQILTDALNQGQGSVVASTPLNTAEFVTVAQIALKVGYDVLNTGLSQVLSRTIFSVRPYERKLKILERDSEAWGNHVRKISYLEQDLEDSKLYDLIDGESVDMYKVKKPKAVQFNFYGYNTFDYDQTIYRKQLQMALRGPEEWAQWLAGLMQHIQNKIEQTHDQSARMCLANLVMGATKTNAEGTVIHLLTEYNAWSGQSVTPSTVFSPGVFEPFARWMFARIETLSKLMTERVELRHAKLNAGKLLRQTDRSDQRLIMFSGTMEQINANVLATTYNTEWLRMIPREDINFWQNINRPEEINAKASYINADGEIQTMAEAETLSPVMGILFDRDAMGYTMVGEEYAVSPYNIKGKYWNHNWSFQDRYYNDFTENHVVMLLD